jgi:hypothetical protein
MGESVGLVIAVAQLTLEAEGALTVGFETREVVL